MVVVGNNCCLFVKIFKRTSMQGIGKTQISLSLRQTVTVCFKETNASVGEGVRPGSCPEKLTYREVLRPNWNNRVYGASKHSFPHCKAFL